MRKCKTCGTTIPSCVESNTCPDCLQEKHMTGFQDNEDPFDLDAETSAEIKESLSADLQDYLTKLGL